MTEQAQSETIQLLMYGQNQEYIDLQMLGVNLAFKGPAIFSWTFNSIQDLPDCFKDGKNTFDEKAPLLIAILFQNEADQLNALLKEEQPDIMLLWLHNEMCKPEAGKLPVISMKQIMEQEGELNWQDMKALAQQPDTVKQTGQYGLNKTDLETVASSGAKKPPRRGLLARLFGG